MPQVEGLAMTERRNLIGTRKSTTNDQPSCIRNTEAPTNRGSLLISPLAIAGNVSW